MLMVASPAPIAGLPTPKAMVRVGPPLSCRGPRSGSALMAPLVIEPSSTMFFVEETGCVAAKSPPLTLLAMIVLAMLRVPPKFAMPPPASEAVLPEMVELVTLRMATL